MRSSVLYTSSLPTTPFGFRTTSLCYPPCFGHYWMERYHYSSTLCALTGEKVIIKIHMRHILYKDLNYHSNVINWQTKEWKALFDIQNMYRPFTQHVSHIFDYSNFRFEFLDNQSEYRKSPTYFCWLMPFKLGLCSHFACISESDARYIQ